LFGTVLLVPAPNKTPVGLLNKNAELSVRLKVSEEQNRLLRAQLERLKALEADHERLKSEHRHTIERNVLLEEEVKWLKAHYYGRSTQKGDAAEKNPDQQMLFNEAEVLAVIAAADEAHENRTTTIERHERRRSKDSGRKPIPKHFPRITITHDLPDDQKMCTRCPIPHPLTRIGEETRECYRFEPPKITVEHHVRPTYVCEQRNEAPVTAPAPPAILPKSNASSSLLAHVIKSKFDMGLPIYRVSRDLSRYQVALSAGTLGTWVNKVGGKKVVPVINLMNEALFALPYWHIDETPLQVLRSGKVVGSDHYIVARAGGPPGQRIILYDYIPSRTRAALKALFIAEDEPYRGKFVSDGLEHYDQIAAELGLLHFGCLTHARTLYLKAHKVSQLPSSRTLANMAIEKHLRPIYGIEAEIRALADQYQQRGEILSLEAIRALREQKTKPLLERFKVWVDELLPGTPPNSALGKALGYTTRQWPKLIRHLDHPEIPIDNTYIERQIKHYATGRKAWLFAYDAVGAQASANLYSLVMTARANGVEPYGYLHYLFDYLPAAQTVDQIEALLPWNVTAAMLEEHRQEQLKLSQTAAA
jgi:transposase